jgi:hypothetical protein
LAARKRSSLKDASPSLVRARFLVLLSLPPLPRLLTRRVCGEHFRLSYTEDPLYGWHYWESDLAPGGIEVSNLFSCVRALSVFRKLLLALYYPFSQYYFLKSVASPPNLSLAGMIFSSGERLGASSQRTRTADSISANGSPLVYLPTTRRFLSPDRGSTGNMPRSPKSPFATVILAWPRGTERHG